MLRLGLIELSTYKNTPEKIKKIIKIVSDSLTTSSMCRDMLPKKKCSFEVNLRNLNILTTLTTLKILRMRISSFKPKNGIMRRDKVGKMATRSITL